MLAALKLLLCSFQLMYASPDLSPIDDTLMVDLAKSIASGQGLGEYNWLTLGKHSFFALWLALLNKLGLNFLIGGQLLFAAAALLLLGALRPLFKTESGAAFSSLASCCGPLPPGRSTALRAYRDNIYPALVLLAFAGLLGAFVRWREAAGRALPFISPQAWRWGRRGCRTRTMRCCCPFSSARRSSTSCFSYPAARGNCRQSWRCWPWCRWRCGAAAWPPGAA